CPAFPPDGAPACTGLDPQLVYPANGVLFPPNLNQLDVHFTPNGAGNLYEIDFTNSVTDVRILTKCNEILDTHAVLAGGCSLSLDKAAWDLIAGTNRGGEALTVRARAS